MRKIGWSYLTAVFAGLLRIVPTFSDLVCDTRISSAKRSDAAWAHAKNLPRWRDTAAKIAAALETAAA